MNGRFDTRLGFLNEFKSEHAFFVSPIRSAAKTEDFAGYITEKSVVEDDDKIIVCWMA